MKLALSFALCICITLCLNPVNAQFKHQLTTKKLPWTKTPDSLSEKFRFVIIGDLTGGEQPGVFDKVIQQINQLAPDFVISVGDLIEGYTLDQITIDRQWESFRSRISKLNAPFFFVAGNHDLSNQLLLENWKQRFGTDYYSFYAGGALFMILNTVEPGLKDISEEQLRYFKGVLNHHDRRIPVYLFSHSPFWKLTGKDGYSELKTLLSGLNVTYFCGHEHRYIYKQVDDQNHYMLAKSGGGFEKPNLNLGEFNHFMYCTSDFGKLTICNILSDGFVPNDVVNNHTESLVEVLRNQNWFSIAPTVIEGDQTDRFGTVATMTNPTDYPLRVSGELPIIGDLTLSPSAVSQVIQPRSQVTFPIIMTSPKPVSTLELPPVLFTFKGSFLVENKLMEAQSNQRWFIDQQHNCMPIAQNKQFFSCSQPGEIEESWSWSDSVDGNFVFSAEHDNANILLHIETTDDLLIADEYDFGKPQDRLMVMLSSDDDSQNRSPLVMELIKEGFKVIHHGEGASDVEITGSCKARGNTLIANISIPRVLLPKDGFRLNIGFADLDDSASVEPSVIWWKPRWNSRLDYRNSGSFKLVN